MFVLGHNQSCMFVHNQVVLIPFERAVRRLLVLLLSYSWVRCRYISKLLSFVHFVLILLQNLVKRLCWFKKWNFVVFFWNYWCQNFLLGLFVVREGILVWFNPKLMSVLQRSFVRILKVNCYRYRKLTVSSVVNFKGSFCYCYQRIRKAMMD